MVELWAGRHTNINVVNAHSPFIKQVTFDNDDHDDDDEDVDRIKMRARWAVNEEEGNCSIVYVGTSEIWM